MNDLEFTINANTTIAEAIEMLKQKADSIANSEEAKKFNRENESWSELFRETYEPYRDAVAQYEEALRLNEWVNGKNPENGHLTIKEAFLKMSDQQRLSFFTKRVNTSTPSIFDEYLKVWWMNRY